MTADPAPADRPSHPPGQPQPALLNDDRYTFRRGRVLLVGDGPEVAALSRAWSGQPLDLRCCNTLTDALLLLGLTHSDAVVIGGVTGPVTPVDFLRTVRGPCADIPVIVGLDDTRPSLGLDALAAGATAIVRRPFDSEDLLRILNAADPAGQSLPARPLPIEVGGRLRVDGTSPRMWLDGVETILPPMEYLLLRYMAGRSGDILARAELVEAVWGEGRHSNTLSVHLARLRRRLEGNTGDDWIRPVRGFGYQFLVPQASRAQPGRRQRARTTTTLQ